MPPPRWRELIADALMLPLMYLISGTIWESPQRTHFWNNKKLSAGEQRSLNFFDMLWVHGDRSEYGSSTFWGIPIFHIPILGGWREYVVLEPEDASVEKWMPGWSVPDFVGVSRIRIRGRVRVLCGPDGAHFYGIDTSGRQINVREVGRGRTGKGGPFRHIPLR